MRVGDKILRYKRMHCKNHMTQQIKKQSFKSLELEIHNLSALDVPNIQSINKWNEIGPGKRC